MILVKNKQIFLTLLIVRVMFKTQLNSYDAYADFMTFHDIK